MMGYHFAIIGCGHIGQRHARHMAALGSLDAVCDIDRGRADDLAGPCGARAYYAVADLLAHEKPDVVAICTPNGLHAAHSIRALEAGAHVLCEKPMTLSVSEGRRMMAAAEHAGRKLFVVKQNRFNPPVVAVKKLLEAEKLGRIGSFAINCFWNRPAAYYESDWRGTLSLDGGTLFTQFSHFIDLLYWFLGEVSEAHGFRANYRHRGNIEFEDTGCAVLKMQSGATGTLNYTINVHPRNMEGSIALFGERGTVKIGGAYLNKLDYFSVENEPEPLLPAGNPPHQYGSYQGSMSNHDQVYGQMIRALEDPACYMLEAGEALQSIAIIEKIYASSPLM